jgi:DHA1 family bicyclomycin/chloramphenicol resistance-like MFS transporter
VPILVGVTTIVIDAPVSRARTARRILILGGLTAFAPLTIDMYLPAMPQIAADLHTDTSQVQLTLTACLIGLAVGQLVAGPISDAVGRRRPLLIGLAIYTLVSLSCAVAPSIWVLTGGRLVQALGAAAGIVVARAVVRDLYEGVGVSKMFSMLMLVTGTAPILAPVIGAQLLRFTNWRGIFVAFALFGLLLMVASAVSLKETLPAERRQPANFRNTLRTSKRLLTDRLFLGCALSGGLALAAMFSYIAGSSFVLQGKEYGLSPQQFSLVFASNAVGLVAVSQLNGRLVGRMSSRRLLAIALVANATGGVLVLLAAATGAGLGLLLPPLFVSVASIGMVTPNAMALAMNDYPDTAGMAAALLGVLQFFLGGLAAPMVGLGGGGAVAMGIVIAVCGLLALTTFVTLVRR